MRRFVSLGVALLSLFVASHAAGEPQEVLTAHATSDVRGGWTLTLEFRQGFGLNARVPLERRLVLRAGPRTWTTQDFEVRAGGARLRTDGAHSKAGALTAYVCRRDLCKKVTADVRFTTP